MHIAKVANQGLHQRKNALFFRKNGDFDPGWALALLYLVGGFLVSSGAMFVAILLKSAVLALGVLSFLLINNLMLLIGVFSYPKAKLLATSPVLKQAFHATATVSTDPEGDTSADIPSKDRLVEAPSEVPEGPPRGD